MEVGMGWMNMEESGEKKEPTGIGGGFRRGEG